MKKEIKLLTHWNYELTPEGMETVAGESLTVPDDGFSLQELVERYGAGGAREGVWLDTDDFDADDLMKLSVADLVDRGLVLDRLAEAIKQALPGQEKASAPKVPPGTDEGSQDKPGAPLGAQPAS